MSKPDKLKDLITKAVMSEADIPTDHPIELEDKSENVLEKNKEIINYTDDLLHKIFGFVSRPVSTAPVNQDIGVKKKNKPRKKKWAVSHTTEGIDRESLSAEGKLIFDAKNGCKESKSKLIDSLLDLIRKFSNKYSYYEGASFLEDNIQSGRVGILTAIDRFDLKLNSKFITFAFPYIRKEIQRNIQWYHHLNEAGAKPANKLSIISSSEDIESSGFGIIFDHELPAFEGFDDRKEDGIRILRSVIKFLDQSDQTDISLEDVTLLKQVLTCFKGSNDVSEILGHRSSKMKKVIKIIKKAKNLASSSGIII